MCKIGTFKGNLSTIFLKVLNIYLFKKIFQEVEIVMLRWNILQYLTKMLRQYFNCSEKLEIFLPSFCNILCYVGDNIPPTTKKFNNVREFFKGSKIKKWKISYSLNIFSESFIKRLEKLFQFSKLKITHFSRNMIFLHVDMITPKVFNIFGCLFDIIGILCRHNFLIFY